MRIKIVFLRNVFTVCIYLSTHSGNRQIIRLNGHFIPHFNYVKVWNKIPKKCGIGSCQNLGKEYFKPLQTKLETFKNIFSMIIDVKLGLQLWKWLNILYLHCYSQFRGLYRVTQKKSNTKLTALISLVTRYFACIRYTHREWWYESVQQY